MFLFGSEEGLKMAERGPDLDVADNVVCGYLKKTDSGLDFSRTLYFSSCKELDA